MESGPQDSVCILVVMEFHAFLHFNLRYGPGISLDTEEFHQVKYIALGTGHIQFPGVYNLFHKGSIKSLRQIRK